MCDEDVRNYDESSDNGNILELDLEHPSSIHDKHSDYSFALESMKLKASMISETSRNPWLCPAGVARRASKRAWEAHQGTQLRWVIRYGPFL